MRQVTTVDVEIKGIRPLLQNDSFEDESSGGKTKTVYVDQEEAEKRLIENKEGVICQKASHLEASMIKSAVDFKFKGQKTYKDIIKAGVIVEPLLIPHLNPEWEIDKQSVKIGTARISRCRPRFDDWDLKFQIKITDDRIEPLTLKSILENAGLYVGIGDYRPRYGLFEIVSWQVRNGNAAPVVEPSVRRRRSE